MKSITPESLIPLRYMTKPLRITFQKRIISISEAMAYKLALKPGSMFILEVDEKKLYFKDSVDKGFKLSSNLPDGRLTCRALAILIALFKEGIIQDSETSAQFKLGEFKEGRWELIPANIIERKIKNNDKS